MKDNNFAEDGYSYESGRKRNKQNVGTINARSRKNDKMETDSQAH